jgi:predicted phage-related endonuclease
MSTITVPKPSDRTEWLATRHPYFNASDAGCLYGVHPFRNLADVAVDKLSPEATDGGESEAMERGTRLEPFLLEWFGDKHGAQVVTPEVLFVEGRLMATLDGEIVGADDEWIEAKTTSQTWSSPPEHVYWQVVAQAAASGRRSCWVVWIDADMRFKEHRIVPEPDHVADVLARSAAFMDFIDLGMTPEGIEMSAEHLARLYPAPKVGTYADIDDEGMQAILRWEQLRRQRVDLEKAERGAKDAVARLIADAEGARYDGRLIATWKANKASERPDWKALEADHADLVATYTREVPGPRVLRATKELTA